MGKKGKESHRSAVSGRYVTERFAKKHPRETVKETDKPKSKGSGKKK